MHSLYQRDPLRILFPETGAEEPLTATVVTTSGGLVGGDRLDIEISAGAQTSSRMMPQAAEKIYRSIGSNTSIHVALHAAEDSWLEWLPQETILFDQSRLRRRTTVRLQSNARALCGEMLVFGRTAMGESMQQGLLRDAWEVYRNERLIWADALQLDEKLDSIFASPGGFGGARAAACAIYAALDAAEQEAFARELIAACDASELHVAVSRIGEVLVVRWLGQNSRVLRHAYGQFWAAFRHQLTGLPPIMPRLWQI